MCSEHQHTATVMQMVDAELKMSTVAWSWTKYMHWLRSMARAVLSRQPEKVREADGDGSSGDPRIR